VEHCTGSTCCSPAVFVGIMLEGHVAVLSRYKREMPHAWQPAAQPASCLHAPYQRTVPLQLGTRGSRRSLRCMRGPDATAQPLSQASAAPPSGTATAGIPAVAAAAAPRGQPAAAAPACSVGRLRLGAGGRGRGRQKCLHRAGASTFVLHQTSRGHRWYRKQLAGKHRPVQC